MRITPKMAAVFAALTNERQELEDIARSAGTSRPYAGLCIFMLRHVGLAKDTTTMPYLTDYRAMLSANGARVQRILRGDACGS